MTFRARRSALPAPAPCATPKTAPRSRSPTTSGSGWRRSSSPAPERPPMVAVKNADVERYIARPDRARPIILVYGPDAGLVRERTEALVVAAVDDPRDP